MFNHYPFLGGMIVGLILALPTGPGAFVVIKQGIRKPVWHVFAIALICVTSDLLWNVILCGVGDISAVAVDALMTHRDTIKAWMGPALIFLGGYIFISEMFAQGSYAIGKMKTFSVAFVNPLVPLTLTTLLVYIIGATYFSESGWYQLKVVSGVFFGEAITWWIGITFFHHLMLNGLNDRLIPYIFAMVFIATGILFLIKGYITAASQ